MVGLARGIVQVVPYDDEWEKLYHQEEKLIYSVIKDDAIDIEHIGSTSIKGLDSKPIIDIALGVRHLDVVSSMIPKLNTIGYHYRGNAGVTGRLFFVKGDEALRTHYLHLVVYDDLLWKNHILFRDYLRENPNAIEAYSTLKKELALKFSDDRSEYTKAKNNFINKILEKASN